DPLLMHQARDQTEQRSARRRETEVAADAFGVGLLSLPIARFELLGEVRARARIPVLVDPVENAGQARFFRTLAQQTIKTVPRRRLQNLPRIRFTDGGDLVRVDNARLHERDLVVKLNPVDLKRAVRRANPTEAVARKIALIGQVVNGEDAGRALAAPS